MRLAKLDLAQAEDDLINTVRQAFLALCINEELLEVARYPVRLPEETLALTVAHYEADLVPRADVAKADSARAAAELELASAENAVASSRIDLNEARGVDVRAEYAVSPPHALEPTPLSVNQLIDIALEHRPEALAARAQVAAAAAALSAAQKAHRPSVSANGSYGWREEDFPPTRDHWNVGLGLHLSIFDGQLVQGQITQARDAEYQTTQRAAQETALSLLGTRTALEEIRSAQVSITSAQEDLELANGRTRLRSGSCWRSWTLSRR